MILIEPAIEKKFGKANFRKRELGALITQAAELAKLSGAVSVLLTGDEAIRKLNREFRHKDKATDVLSFPVAEGNGGGMAGDLAISVETAAREAEARGHSLVLELKILLLHGVLHLAGFDHETDSGEMARREAALRRKLGLTVGLIERAADERVKTGRSPHLRRRNVKEPGAKRGGKR
jgi:probable rRNA maturation factor